VLEPQAQNHTSQQACHLGGEDQWTNYQVYIWHGHPIIRQRQLFMNCGRAKGSYPSLSVNEYIAIEDKSRWTFSLLATPMALSRCSTVQLALGAARFPGYLDTCWPTTSRKLDHSTLDIYEASFSHQIWKPERNAKILQALHTLEVIDAPLPQRMICTPVPYQYAATR
jgi:hypothetical protein